MGDDPRRGNLETIAHRMARWMAGGKPTRQAAKLALSDAVRRRGDFRGPRADCGRRNEMDLAQTSIKLQASLVSSPAP